MTHAQHIAVRVERAVVRSDGGLIETVFLHADFIHSILTCAHVRKGCFHTAFIAAVWAIGTIL